VTGTPPTHFCPADYSEWVFGSGLGVLCREIGRIFSSNQIDHFIMLLALLLAYKIWKAIANSKLRLICSISDLQDTPKSEPAHQAKLFQKHLLPKAAETVQPQE